MIRRPTLLATSIAAVITCNSAQAAPSQEEMWDMLQTLKKQNEALQQEVQQLKNDQHKTNDQLEATAAAIEETGNRVTQSVGWFERTQIGGYGELHYNNLHDSDGNDKEEIDLHRFVLFVSHEFTDDIRFFSEFEIEHDIAGEGKNGEVEVEQAFIDFDLNDNHTARAGLFLLPIGIINETHEPPTFYGVERNVVENNIIPVTWWEGGVGLHGKLGNGLSYDAYVHSGLNVPVAGGNAFRIRSGRQKVSEANARDWATTGRLKYTGIAGLELSLSLQYAEDITQGAANAEALFWETHLIYNTGPFTLKALYAAWDIDSEAFKNANADEQYGWYIEPSWKLNTSLGLFARYSEFERAKGDLDAFQQIDFGVNYYPHEDVVLKADYQIQQSDRGEAERDGFNLGIGYQF